MYLYDNIDLIHAWVEIILFKYKQLFTYHQIKSFEEPLMFYARTVKLFINCIVKIQRTHNNIICTILLCYIMYKNQRI